MASIKQTLEEIMSMEGALCAAVVDSSSGMILGSAGTAVDEDDASFGLE